MGVNAAAVERQQPFRDARGPGAIVFDPARLRQAEPAMLEPEYWGARAEPVSGQGGRGAAWFVSGDDGDAVLRHYRRGGFMARGKSIMGSIDQTEAGGPRAVAVPSGSAGRLRVGRAP
jgi:3-deoxy-D-manno-octulosonic acid kinase